MATIRDPALREASTLIHILELVLRKLIRLLIGKISLRKIQEMIQIIFVEEAEAKLKRKNPEENVALADLALLADTDPRTIKRVRSYTELSTPLHEDSTFLSELSPETCVLDFWQMDSKYQDPETGKPAVLNVSGPGICFETLIEDATSTNGVVIDAFLRRMAECGCIDILPGGEQVRFVNATYTSFASSDMTEGIRIGLFAVSNLLETITHNIRAPIHGNGAFYQRGCWTTRLSRQDRNKLRKMTSELLLKSDEKARELIGSYERKSPSTEHITAGVSMFYFENEMAA